MAKFCTKCGKPLVEGQTCNCGNEERPEVETMNFGQPSANDFQQANQMNQNMGTGVQPQMQPAANNGNAKNLFNDCLNIVKNFFKKPVSTIEENANDNKMVHAIIMVVLNALAAGLFVILLVKELEEAIVGLMLSMSGLGSYGAYGSMDELTSAIEIPYVKIFLVTAVIIIAIVALAVALNYLLTNKVFKMQTTFKRILTVYGFSSIISTVGFLLATICNYIDGRLGLAVLAIGLLLSQHYVSVTTPAACNNADKNKLGYSVVLSIFVAIVVVAYITYKLMS